MDVQQEGSLRQVFRTSRNQRPFSVTVDEFYNFADLSIVDSLNKLRDANLEYTLAHQSLADLELVSKEFATAVWDNTRTKDILNQDNPELCERIARSIGTRQIRELTVRRKEGPLLTSLATGDASSRLVEAYRLHPNAIKALARCGQGYSLSDEGLAPVAYPLMPALSADYPLARRDQKAAIGLRLYETFVADLFDPLTADPGWVFLRETHGDEIVGIGAGGEGPGNPGTLVTPRAFESLAGTRGPLPTDFATKTHSLRTHWMHAS